MSVETGERTAGRVPLFGPVFVTILHLAALPFLPELPSLLAFLADPTLARLIATPTIVLFIGLEAASLLICAFSLAGTGSALRTTLVLWGIALGLFGLVLFAQETLDDLTLVALTLVAVATLLGYGLHRYERVRLGLVSENP